MKKPILQLAVWSIALMLIGMTACSQKRKPLVPLALDGEVKSQAMALTEQPAHYNYALALNALGDSDVARQHFLQAADLSPGDKVIWDSPALSPYGNPENKNRKSLRPPVAPRSSFGSSMPRY